MQDREGGLKPSGEGWFVVNAREAEWVHNEEFGAGVTFEGTPHFARLGINIQVIWPGQPNGYYHAEKDQEDFLVLSGKCLLLIEGEERRLKAWDFFHCAPGTNHIIVGAGDGPCAILMAGLRGPGKELHYPVSEAAARYGASTPEETNTPRVAYSDWNMDLKPFRAPWPL